MDTRLNKQDLIKIQDTTGDGQLPPIVPLLLYNGEARWNAATELSELIVQLPGGLEHYRPALRYLILDEGVYDQAELAPLKNLVAAIFRLENAQNPAEIVEVINHLLEWLQTPEQARLRRSFTVWIKPVLLPDDSDESTFQRINDLTEIKAMLKQRVSKWIREWKQQGEVKGKITAQLSSAGGRDNNQDHCGFVELNSATGCWVMADGLGGHQGGEVASKLLVEHLLSAYQQRPACTSEALHDYLSQAQNALHQAQQDQPAFADMRSTVVVLLQEAGQALWAHSGDSRLYQFRQGQVRFQTKDHSVPQMLVTAGEIEPEAMRSHADRSRLLRCAGEAGELKATYLKAEQAVQPGDVFLLCSDGFWEYVLESEMESDLARAQNPDQWLRMMQTRLLDKASGEYDNYTALTVWCQG